MSRGSKLISGALALLVVFLAGYVPSRLALQSARQEVQALREQVGLAQLRDHAALVYLETTQKNYGIAGQHASRYFEQLREAVDQTPDAGRKQALQELLARRDEVISGLAKGDGSVMPVVDALFRKTHELR